MTSKPFTPTHSVTFDSDGVPRDVMLEEGVAYSAFEWDTGTSADLEVSPDGAWLFQGRPFPGTVYTVPWGPRVWPSADRIVTEAATFCAAEALRMGAEPRALETHPNPVLARMCRGGAS